MTALDLAGVRVNSGLHRIPQKGDAMPKIGKTATGLAIAATCGVIVATMSASTALAASATPQTGAYCTTTVDNPHSSSGAGGIIVKARTTCENNAASFDLIFYLLKCTSSSLSSCTTAVEDTNDSLDHPANGVAYTSYCPDIGKPGAQGAGYYAGKAITIITGHQGTAYSNVVKLP